MAAKPSSLNDVENILLRRFASWEEAWITAYRFRPYLMGRPHSDLIARLEDVLRNVFTISSDGKIGFPHPDNGRAFWMEKLAHVNQEAFRRGGPDLVDLTNPTFIPFTKEALALTRGNLNLAPHFLRRPVFARFGALEHIRDLQDHGRLLLSPASYYKDRSLGNARQDDELYLESYSAPCDYELGLISDEIRTRFPQRQWLTHRVRKPTNFYIYCVTTKFDFRYFVDFALTPGSPPACLLITDQNELEERLIGAVKVKLPGWRVEFGPAHYFDPFVVGHRLDWPREQIYFSKNFRYLYQGEHRLIAVPPIPIDAPLDRIPLELGSLRDISELITLQTA